MQRSNFLWRSWPAVAAWAVFAIAWFLPAVDTHSEFALRLPGWKAFLAAATVAWDGGKTNFEWIRILSLAGILSNVPVLMSPWIFLRGAPVPRWFATVMVAAFAVNLAWLPMFKTAELRLGYWLWLGSMGVLAAIAIARSRREANPRLRINLLGGSRGAQPPYGTPPP
jgi:hypothetical protein